MRRLIALGVTFASMLMGASPATAAGNTFHFSASGPGAEAFWTTLPLDTAPEPNVVYTDTFVFTAERAIREDGTRFDDKFLFFDQFSFKFDRRGNFIFVSETFGFAGGADVALSVDPRLTSATADATVALTTCTDGRRGFTCTDAGSGTVSASWTGQGDVVRVNGNFTIVSQTFTETSHFRGTFRQATATGQLNGSSFGTSLFADLFDASFRDVFVCHGC